MGDDEIPDKEAADDLDPAFDSIDATMKDGVRKVTVTPEALAQIVSDAVTKAITAYKQSTGATPESEAAPGQPAAVPLTPRRTKIEQLKDDMGLDEIKFEGPPQEAVETRIDRELSSQMGVHDFEFEDAPGQAAESDAPTRTEADAIAGWGLTGQDAAPPAMPDVVDETPAPAVDEETTADAEPEFDWVAEEVKRLEAEEVPTALDPEPVRIQPPEAPEGSDRGPRHADLAWRGGDPSELLARGQTPPPAAPKPEVRETRKGLAGWFRSVLGDTPQEREPAAAVPVPEPAAPIMPEAVPPPEPDVAAPPPIAARIEEPPRPRRDPAAVLKPMTPEEAATTVFFTFDPIPPVPPRLPREPKESAKD